ncbi:MAG: hypothetical protein U0457_11105 [Candidatus Sericytochromatia bacterium]
MNKINYKLGYNLAFIIKSLANLRKIIFSFIFFTILIANLPVYSKDEKGFDSKSDIRAGFSLKYGGDFFNKKYQYLFPFSFIGVDFQAESASHGTSTLSVTWFNNKRIFDLNSYNVDEYPFLDNAKTLTKGLFEVNFSSALFYKQENPYEWGWIGGFYNQNINSDIPISGTSENNTGLVFGSYLKFSNLYPFVPTANIKLLLGSFYDNYLMKQTKGNLSQSQGIKICYDSNLNFDWYLNRNFVFSFGYNINNFDFINFGGSKFKQNKASSFLNFIENKEIYLENSPIRFTDHVNNLYIKTIFFF